MTPAARIAAAIEILDRVFAGDAAERALTTWARGNRYAGSKDRAAIRDHVFDALRCRRSYAALGGADTGRGIMIGAERAAGRDPGLLFTGEGHAPTPQSAAEISAGKAPAAGAEALDCPDWLWPHLQASLGDDCDAALAAQRSAAPVTLRANFAATSREAVAAELETAGHQVHADARSPGALIVEGRPRGLQTLPGYLEGRFELQDLGAQILSDLVPLTAGQRLLDYCAGGGGKTLAVAARVPGAAFVAHDGDPRRMADLPKRAARAGIAVTCLGSGKALPASDTVLVDAPCSGTGTWRRAPEAKWRLTDTELSRLVALQARILRDAAQLVKPGGHLVYMTCALTAVENRDQIASLVRDLPGFDLAHERVLLPDATMDGFFIAILHRDDVGVR